MTVSRNSGTDQRLLRTRFLSREHTGNDIM